MGFTRAMAALSLVGTAMGTVGAYQQAKAQQSQANYSAAIAEKNQELAQDPGGGAAA